MVAVGREREEIESRESERERERERVSRRDGDRGKGKGRDQGGWDTSGESYETTRGEWAWTGKKAKLFLPCPNCFAFLTLCISRLLTSVGSQKCQSNRTCPSLLLTSCLLDALHPLMSALLFYRACPRYCSWYLLLLVMSLANKPCSLLSFQRSFY